MIFDQGQNWFCLNCGYQGLPTCSYTGTGDDTVCPKCSAVNGKKSEIPGKKMTYWERMLMWAEPPEVTDYGRIGFSPRKRLWAHVVIELSGLGYLFMLPLLLTITAVSELFKEG